MIKKVSKMVKNRENPFLGRKRKRRGSMRFGKNAPTRWLGKRIKWHLPPKVTYPPFFDPFSHVDVFFTFSFYHFLHFDDFPFSVFCHFFCFCQFWCFSLFHHFMTLITVRPYYGVKTPVLFHRRENGCYVWWLSPHHWRLLLLCLFMFFLLKMSGRFTG